RSAAKVEPLLIVVDDLHWVDKPSLLLLQFLAREIRHSRLLIVGTYRQHEIGRQHPLSKMLGELTLSQRVLLTGLREEDVARVIETASGSPPSPALARAVHQHTEGNPFFVSEIIRLLAAEGRLERPGDQTRWSVTIPQGIREVIGRRLDRVSEDCNSVLTIAS